MKNKDWRAGNQNAAKPADKKRVPITIRLPRDLIEQLKARGEVTAQIESAVRNFIGGFMQNKYIDSINTAERILEALGIRREDDGSYLVTLRNRHRYHDLIPENAECLIDEILAEHAIDWFDDEQTRGNVEINGTIVEIQFAESQAA